MPSPSRTIVIRGVVVVLGMSRQGVTMRFSQGYDQAPSVSRTVRLGNPQGLRTKTGREYHRMTRMTRV